MYPLRVVRVLSAGVLDPAPMVSADRDTHRPSTLRGIWSTTVPHLPASVPNSSGSLRKLYSAAVEKIGTATPTAQSFAATAALNSELFNCPCTAISPQRKLARCGVPGQIKQQLVIPCKKSRHRPPARCTALERRQGHPFVLHRLCTFPNQWVFSEQASQCNCRLPLCGADKL